MARKASQARSRRFYGEFTQQEVKHAWEALRRHRAFCDAVRVFLESCDAECPSLAERIRQGDFPSPAEYVAILEALPEGIARGLADRAEDFAETWKVRPLNPDLPFEQLPDRSGRGIPPALYGLHRALWPDMLECPEMDQAADASSPRRSNQWWADFGILRGEGRAEALRASGWTPPEKITFTVDLRFPLPDLIDRFSLTAGGFQEMRAVVLGTPPPRRAEKRHWQRLERQWRVWDHVARGDSLPAIARRFGTALATVRRDFVSAARAVGDVPTAIRESRREGLGAASSWTEISRHTREHGAQCPAKGWEDQPDRLTDCAQLRALLGPHFSVPKWDWTSAGKGRARLATAGAGRRKSPRKV